MKVKDLQIINFEIADFKIKDLKENSGNILYIPPKTSNVSAILKLKGSLFKTFSVFCNT